MMEDLASGKPNSEFAQIQSTMSKLGPLQSLVFKGVGPGGADIYSVRFEKGALEARIWLGVDGKIENANARPDEGGVGMPVASLRPHFPEIESLVAAELAKRPVGIVTAGVVSSKDLVWSKSYGDADMEKKTPADTDTVYRIGFITKMFTALMLEQLLEANTGARPVSKCSAGYLDPTGDAHFRAGPRAR